MHSNSINLSVRGLEKSATLAINERSKELLRQGKKIYKFGLGQSPFPVPNCVVEELRRHAHEKDYLSVIGLPELRETIAQFHLRHDEVTIHPDNILIGPGSKELMFILQLVFYGDILIPSPCWVSYAPQAQIIGRRVKFIATSFETHWRLAAEDLEKICAKDPQCPRLLILNYPGNPEGSNYTLEELTKIAEVARKYEVIVLSDEIYSLLTFSGKHVSIAPLYPEGTILSSGLSKWCGAGGWRLGTFAFPENLKPLLNAMAVVASETYTSVNAPAQYAAIKAFQQSKEIDDYLQNSNRVLNALGQYCYQKIHRTGANICPPRGAFYLFPDFTPLQKNLHQRGIYTSDHLCERLLEETGVAILPGTAFQRPEHEFTVRLAYVDFDGKAALQASETREVDQAFLEEFCPSVVEGIHKLTDWITE